MPPVAGDSGPPDGPGAGTTDPQRNVGLLDGLGRKPQVGKAPTPALIAGVRAGLIIPF